MNNSLQASKPEWLLLSNQNLLPIIEHTVAWLVGKQNIDPQNRIAPVLAAIHLHQSIRASIRSNLIGHHSVAMALLRQCVEASTIIEIGFQNDDLMKKLLEDWRKDKGHGALRKILQAERWKKYGPGLWGEPWEEYFGNLALAIQPYAHYTELLMGWQYVLPPTIKNNIKNESTTLHVTWGLDEIDSMKLIRIQLFQSLVGWTLARLLEENNVACPMHGIQLTNWGQMMRSSELFDDITINWREHWKDQFLPFLWFTVDDWKS